MNKTPQICKKQILYFANTRPYLIYVEIYVIFAFR